MELREQHAVVTGGSRGIGAAIAAVLDEAGARTTIMGRHRDALEERAGKLHNGHAVCCDVADEEAVSRAFGLARDAFGPVDILVNNAGRALSLPFSRTEWSHFRDVMSVNLRGTFLCTQAVVDGMKKKGAGRIVNIASTAALKGYAYASAYAASKHAVVGLTRCLALELAPAGITVNAVCPGFTETGMLEGAVEKIAVKTGRTREQARAALTRNNPQRRFIKPEEVASVVLWLCLPDSESITGQAIAVAGGEVM